MTSCTIEKICNHCKKTFKINFIDADDACHQYAQGHPCPHCGQNQNVVPTSSDSDWNECWNNEAFRKNVA